MNEPGSVTKILARIGNGDNDAVDDLYPIVYGELRRIAAGYLRRERTGHTLQPTALTHEALLRLVGSLDIDFKDRAHFLALAARAMRRVLVDHGRARRTKKRTPVAATVRNDPPTDLASGLSVDDLLALDQALDTLSRTDERKSRVVELLYFGGLTALEAGEVLGVSERTIERDWRFARVWLYEAINSRGAGSP